MTLWRPSNMFPMRTVIAALFVLGLAVAAEAQTPPAPTFDVSRLPVDLDRVQRKLQQTSVREEREGLNLRYIIEVFGQAPPLVVFTPEDNLVNGPVPHGAPTHREMIEHVTPREYRAPPADISALIRWLRDRGK